MQCLHLVVCADVGEEGFGEGAEGVVEGEKQVYYLDSPGLSARGK